ncbi:MAG: siphovirus ReqiPepy6 Gp37-like family protein [Clostridia bacterium]|nr:siphovirus ReqiPepy6 Gp37-like family protein [Clostridia bacterium]
MIIATIYDNELTVIGNVVQWKSLIRTELLRGAGEFEMKLPASPTAVSCLLQGYFISFSDTPEKAFLIESVEPDILQNDMDTIVVSGRDLKALLSLRVVWGLQKVSGTPWNRMYWLIHYQAIAPSSGNYPENRVIPYLQDLARDGDDSGDTVEASQFTGDNLLDTLVSVVGTNECGWRVELDVRDQQITPIFFTGTDRTGTVQFHNLLGNLKNLSYLRDIADSANVAIIGGEGEGSARTYNNAYSADYAGLKRRELFVDARDLQSEDYDTKSAYNTALQNRGIDKLAEHTLVQNLSFDTVSGIYQYGIDFKLGDTVKIVNTDVLGISATARVIGMQISDDSEGHNETPTVEILDMEVVV